MKTRRKRPIPIEWAVADTISLFKPITSLETPCAEASFLSVRKSDSTALIGGHQGGVYTVQASDGTVNTISSGTEPITSGVWVGSRIAIATSTGKVKIVEQDQEIASFQAHSGSISAIALHPTGDILASVSSDKSYALYDLETNRLLTQVHTSTGKSVTTVREPTLTVSRINMHFLPSRRSLTSRRRQRRPPPNLRCKIWTTWRSIRPRRTRNSNLLFRERNMASHSHRRFIFSQHLGSKEIRR